MVSFDSGSSLDRFYCMNGCTLLYPELSFFIKKIHSHLIMFVIVFISKVIMCLTLHWQLNFSITVNSLILTISLREIKEIISKLQTMNFLNSDWFRRFIASSNRTTCPPVDWLISINLIGWHFEPQPIRELYVCDLTIKKPERHC
jgi:hypothetical protein